MTLVPGSLLNERYRILNVLGHGGMGSVYRVFDEFLKATFALKQNLFLTDEYTEQFHREASIMASLHHHNLPRVGDYFKIPGRGQYLIMEYVEGEDLRQRIERLHKLPEGEVILIGLVICEAINYLHSRQPPIIHRDIKPGNIRITPRGEVFLVDFGLAKAKIGSQETITGARAMTPGYSPPEQYGSARTDERSDIYSLGATLYAALTGMIPCDGLERITGKSRLVKTRDINPSISQALSHSIEKAMEVDTDDRYQTAEEFQNALFEAGNIADKLSYPLTVHPPPYDEVMSDEGMKGPGEENLLLNGNGFMRSARRHKPLVTSMVVLFGILLILLAVLLPGQPDNFFRQLLGSLPLDQTNSVIITTSPVESSIPGSSEIMSTEQPSVVTAKTDEATGLLSTPIPGERAALIEGGEIAFASDRSGRIQIWIINSDGSNLRQLTFFEDGACQHAWSEDGEQLAFISPCSVDSTNGERTIIYIMNADGSDIRPLIPQTEINIKTNPVWRPGDD